MGSVYIATAALNLDMIVGMDATATSTGSFDLTLTPVIGISGEERYVAEFGLTLTPQIGMVAYIKQLPIRSLGLCGRILWPSHYHLIYRPTGPIMLA